MKHYAPLVKMDPVLAQHFKTLRAAAPEAANAIANKMMTDHMVPGIGNKLAYEDFLSRPRQGVHVLLDGNDFGQVNKRFGQAHGDKAIVAMGTAIANARKQYRGKMFRVGGDEFRLWFEKPEHAYGFLRDMRRNLEELPPVQGAHFHSVSAGIGPSPEHADAALIHAKNAKKEAGYAPGHAQTHIHSLLPGSEGPVGGTKPVKPTEGIAAPVKKSDGLDEMAAQLQMREAMKKMALVHDDAKRPTYVYRIENDFGQGPHNGGVVYELPDPARPYGGPGPGQDFPEHEIRASGLSAGSPRFGFMKPEDLEEWWGADNIAELRRKGFYVKKIPAARVWLSNSGRQVMFHPALPKKQKTPDTQMTLSNPETGALPRGIVPPNKGPDYYKGVEKKRR